MIRAQAFFVAKEHRWDVFYICLWYSLIEFQNFRFQSFSILEQNEYFKTRKGFNFCLRGVFIDFTGCCRCRSLSISNNLLGTFYRYFAKRKAFNFRARIEIFHSLIQIIFNARKRKLIHSYPVGKAVARPYGLEIDFVKIPFFRFSFP